MSTTKAEAPDNPVNGYDTPLSECIDLPPQVVFLTRAEASWRTSDILEGQVKYVLAETAEALHLAIMQAVSLFNQGAPVNAHNLLRQTLVDYADGTIANENDSDLRHFHGEPLADLAPAGELVSREAAEQVALSAGYADGDWSGSLGLERSIRDGIVAGLRALPPVARVSETPLCPMHEHLESLGKLEVEIGGMNCLACTLHERVELLGLLANCEGVNSDSVIAMSEVVDFWFTHHGENRVVVSYPAPEGDEVARVPVANKPCEACRLDNHNKCEAAWIDAFCCCADVAEARKRVPVAAEKAQFTDNELEYIYLHCDCDTDRSMFLQIEKKVRKQISKYRDFDTKHCGSVTPTVEEQD
jgi:hypothetical protein